MNSINKLLEVMKRLRDPEQGCPWDREQDFASIAPYTLEEAYEVVDTIDRQDLGELKDELGDLLLQVVFHAQMAEEIGAFDFSAVAEGITEKMIRRHPHVFGGESVDSAKAQREAWEGHKAQERAGRAPASGILSDVPLALPALMRAEKMGKRASRVGFDWPSADGVLEKVTEELGELERARKAGDESSIMEEMGDLLFTVASLARHVGVDPEEALRRANGKFARRFALLEDAVQASETDWPQLTMDELEGLWQSAKKRAMA